MNKIDLINVMDSEKNIFAAVENGYLEILKELLDEGFDFGTPDEYGDTPLMIACENGCLDIVRELLKHNADAEVIDQQGRTALMLACKYDSNIEIVKELVINGANIEVRDQEGMNPLMIACAYNCLEIVKFLIDSGSNLDVSDSNGTTLLMHASQHCNHKEIIQLLLEEGCCAYNKNSSGNTFFDYHTEENKEFWKKFISEKIPVIVKPVKR